MVAYGVQAIWDGAIIARTFARLVGRNTYYSDELHFGVEKFLYKKVIIYYE